MALCCRHLARYAIAVDVVMINGIFSTFSGKVAAERKLDVVANNLANAFTAGFKASRPVYNGSIIDGDSEPDQLSRPMSIFPIPMYIFLTVPS